MLLKEKCLNDKDKDKDKENRNCNNLTDFAEPLSKNGARKTAYSSQRKKIQKIASKHSRHRLMISKLPK